MRHDADESARKPSPTIPPLDVQRKAWDGGAAPPISCGPLSPTTTEPSALTPSALLELWPDKKPMPWKLADWACEILGAEAARRAIEAIARSSSRCALNNLDGLIWESGQIRTVIAPSARMACPTPSRRLIQLLGAY
jgi:hypothetical protein